MISFYICLLILATSLQFRMKSFASKLSFLFMTLVFPLSTNKCSVALIFIFSGKKILFIHFFGNFCCQHLACFLSHFTLLMGSALCHFLDALCFIWGHPETSASFPFNSLSLFFFIFYFFFNSSQSKTPAPSLTTSEQIFALEFYSCLNPSCHIENSWRLKGEERGFSRQAKDVSNWFSWATTLIHLESGISGTVS